MPQDTADLEAIATLPFIQRLPDYMHQSMARLLLGISERHTCEPDEIVIREGAVGGTLGYVLLSGSVRVDHADDAPVTLTPPALLGEMYQFSPHTGRYATVATLTPAEILAFSWHELYERVRSIFPTEDQHLVLESLEKQVEERLRLSECSHLPLFRGLPEPLRVKLCLMMVWLGRPKLLEAGEVLFEQGTLCGNSGFLLQRGALSLGGEQETIRTAPDIIGVLPEFAPGQRWSASAKAGSRAEVLVFNWIDLLKRLQQRLAPEEHSALLETLRANAGGHFTH